MIKQDIRPIENTNLQDSMELDEKIRAQNEAYYEIYDFIVKNVPKEEQILILNANGQAIPDKDDQVGTPFSAFRHFFMRNQFMEKMKCFHFIAFCLQILHQLTDVIYFGALKKCNRCENGQLVFCNWRYKCTNGTGWTKCGNEVKEPERYCAWIPELWRQNYPFLVKHCGIRTRELHAFRFFDEQDNDLVYG